MQLFLANNDPLHTLLLSQDGKPLYNILSSPITSPQPPLSPPPSHSPDSPSPSSVSSSAFSSDPSPSPVHPGHRQPLPNVHPAIPITRTHSTPHPDQHRHHPDPSSPHPSPVLHPLPAPTSIASSPASSHPAAPSGVVTTIKRLDRCQSSRGNVETEIGLITSSADDAGAKVLLCSLGMEICTPPVRTKNCSAMNPAPAAATAPTPPAPVSHTALSRMNDAGTALEAFRDFCNESQRKKEISSEPTSGTSVSVRDSNNDNDFVPEPTWSFKGPDNRPYKWLSLASNPVLIHDTQPPTPIACYRPAKLGIISRSRRAFLEILPPGLEKEDWVIVTFVGYFRMKLGDRIQSHIRQGQGQNHDHLHPDTNQRFPIGNMDIANVVPKSRLDFLKPKAMSEPSTPSITPLRDPMLKMPVMTPSLPAAYVEALRRKNRNQNPKRTW